MVSWVPHIVLPLLVALAFFRTFPRKWVWLMAPIVWVPDLDFVSPDAHRAFSHNLFVPMLPLVALWWLWRRRNLREGDVAPFWSFATTAGWPAALALSSYYWATHVLLDVFAGGALLFWPLSQTNFYFFYELHFDLQKLQEGEIDPQPIAEVGTEQGVPEVSQDYAWISFEHTATLGLLAIIGAVAFLRHLVARGRRLSGKDKAPPRVERP